MEKQFLGFSFSVRIYRQMSSSFPFINKGNNWQNQRGYRANGNLTSSVSSDDNSRMPFDQNDDYDMAVLHSLHEQITKNSKRKDNKRHSAQQPTSASSSVLLSRPQSSFPTFEEKDHGEEPFEQFELYQHKGNRENGPKRSAFSFIQQQQRAQSIVIPRFSSSFIIEDMLEEENQQQQSAFGRGGSNSSSINGNRRPGAASASASSNKSQQNMNGSNITATNGSSGRINDSDSTETLSNIKLNQMLLHQPTFNFVSQDRLPAVSSRSTLLKSLSDSEYSEDSDDDEQATKSVRSLSGFIRQSDSEVHLLHYTARYERLQNKKSRQADLIKRLHKRQEQTLETIHQIRDKLSELKEQQFKAVADEDFEAAESNAQQQRLLESNLQELQTYLTDTLQTNLKTARQRYQSLLLKEEEVYLDPLIQCYHAVKQTRERHLDQFIQDTGRLRDTMLTKFRAKEAALESEKSELALDVDLMHQNETELESLITEATHKDMEKEKDLKQQVDKVQEEIDALRLQLQTLEADKRTKENELRTLTNRIKETRDQFKSELNSLSKDRSEIGARRLDIEKKGEELNEEAELMNQRIEKWLKEKQNNERELRLLDKRIEEAEVTKDKDKRALKKLMLVSQRLEECDALNSLNKNKNCHEFICLQEEIETLRQRIHKRTAKLRLEKESYLQLNDTIFQLTQRIRLLTSYKERAVQNEQFSDARKYASEIKSCEEALSRMKEELTKLKKQGVDPSVEKVTVGNSDNSLNSKEKEFLSWKHQLVELEKEYKAVSEERDAEFKANWEHIKEELSRMIAEEEGQDDIVHIIIKAAIWSIDLMLLSNNTQPAHHCLNRTIKDTLS